MKNFDLIMSTMILAVTFLASMLCGAPPDASWLTDLSKAEAKAKQESKLLLIVASMEGCGPCKKMSETTWVDGSVRQLIEKDFVPCFMMSGSDEVESWMDKNDIVAFPTILVFSSEGKELMRSAGYIDAPSMHTMLMDVPRPKTGNAAEKADNDKASEKTDSTQKMDKEDDAKKGDKEPETKAKKSDNDDDSTSKKSDTPKVRRSASAHNVNEMMVESLHPEGIKPPRPQSYIGFEKPTLRQRAADRTERVFRGIGRGVKNFGRGLLGRTDSNGGGGADADPTQVLAILESIGKPVAPENKKPDVEIKVSTGAKTMKSMFKEDANATAKKEQSKSTAKKKDSTKADNDDEQEATTAEKTEEESKSTEVAETPEPTPKPKLDKEKYRKMYSEAMTDARKSYTKNALALCEKIVREDTANESGIADMAYIMMASLTASQQDELLYAKAYDMLVQFEARYPNSPNRDYYTIVRASLARGLKKDKEANLLMRNFPKEFPNSKRQKLARDEWGKLTGQKPPSDDEVAKAKSAARKKN
ncbi:hypothetical protein GX645_00485 [Candidatus Sumerlaeota bacterium]|nr:thioredoxin family protein [Candidatus Sumerlaeales bacterium]NLD60917.1 hypothetical protein [Candidatus Sumerlaeota bacterium]